MAAETKMATLKDEGTGDVVEFLNSGDKFFICYRPGDSFMRSAKVRLMDGTEAVLH